MRARARTSSSIILAIAALAGGVLLGGSTAWAQDTGFYVGGSVGQSKERFDTSDDFFAGSSSTGFEIAAGFRPLQLLGAEINYLGFARAFSGINYVDTSGVGAFALGYLPIPVVQLFGKVGVLDWRTDAQEPGYSLRHSGANLAYGVGASTSFGKLGVRLQFEQYDISDTSLMDLTSIGLTWGAVALGTAAAEAI